MKPSLLRGSLETIILKMLSDHGAMYGYELTKMAKERSDDKIKITEGALYPILHRLEANGVVEVESREENNRIRKYYKLTEQGTKEVKSSIADMKEYIEVMKSIIAPHNDTNLAF